MCTSPKWVGTAILRSCQLLFERYDNHVCHAGRATHSRCEQFVEELMRPALAKWRREADTRQGWSRKTRTSEFGLLRSTETLLEGLTRNPWGSDQFGR